MTKYINADAFIQKMQRVLDENNDTSTADTILRRVYEIIIGDLKETPAADVREVKHGKWIVAEYEYLICSHCGASYYMGYTGAKSIEIAKEYLDNYGAYKYCPDCGAKMDEKENDE